MAPGAIIRLSILSVFLLSKVSVNGEYGACPTWFYNTSEGCHCGYDNHGTVLCNKYEETVFIRVDQCMTLNSSSGETVVNKCIYGYSSEIKTKKWYASLPKDPNELDNYTCRPFHREGVLCQNCINGFGPSLSLLKPHCINCAHHSAEYEIALLITLHIFPLTLFCICILPFMLMS